MKTIFKTIAITVSILSLTLVTSCSPEDGKDGVNGTNGMDASLENTGFNVAYGFGGGTGNGQNIPTATFTKVTFLNEITDDLDAFSTATSELTIPSDGFYHLTTSARFATNLPDDTPVIIEIRKNNNVLNYFVGRLTGVPSISVTSNVRLVTGDKITVYVFHNSGASRFLTNNPADTFFSGYRVY